MHPARFPASTHGHCPETLRHTLTPAHYFLVMRTFGPLASAMSIFSSPTAPSTEDHPFAETHHAQGPFQYWLDSSSHPSSLSISSARGQQLCLVPRDPHQPGDTHQPRDPRQPLTTGFILAPLEPRRVARARRRPQATENSLHAPALQIALPQPLAMPFPTYLACNPTSLGDNLEIGTLTAPLLGSFYQRWHRFSTLLSVQGET